ncbi:MAG: hypothetical protein NTX26_02275 [Candidatus Parcubacteria bacterium]|nr:hypothetical protein [Candidatus Parcubacteria bacterium]
MLKIKNLFVASGILCLFVSLSFSPKPALAGFGISPPYVNNNNLSRGSYYEQKIVLVRGDPTDDWQAEITLDLPNANGWISIDKGNSFILPKGVNQIPIIVSVRVPQDASYGDYKGSINIRTLPVATPQQGVVSIALGAQIDVNLRVSRAKIFDFALQNINFGDASASFKDWLGFTVPAHIFVKMQIENKGNYSSAPTKLLLNISRPGQSTVFKTVSTTHLPKVAPFGIEWISANLPVDLAPGGYSVEYQLFKNQNVAYKGTLDLSVIEKDTSTYSLWQKTSNPTKLICLVTTLTLIGIIVLIVWIIKRKMRRQF